jgi:hypothetical protein
MEDILDPVTKAPTCTPLRRRGKASIFFGGSDSIRRTPQQLGRLRNPEPQVQRLPAIWQEGLLAQPLDHPFTGVGELCNVSDFCTGFSHETLKKI